MAARARGGAGFGAVRKLVTAALLVAIGGSVGLVVGSVSNVPELLLTWLAHERTTVSLGVPSAPPAAEMPAAESTELREFPNLQKPAPRAPPPPAVAAPPPPASAPAAPNHEAVIAAIERKRVVAPAGPVVQIASYTDPRSADALVARLRRLGFDSYVSNTSPQGEPRFRVRVRPAPGEDPARIASKLSANGFSVWVTRE